MVERQELSEVCWAGDELRVRAIISNDSDLWLVYRVHLLSALRVAAQYGGRGEIVVCGYSDGGPELATSVTLRADGSSKLTVSKAAAAERKARKVYRDVDGLLDDLPAPPPGRLELPKKLAVLYDQVIAALHKADAKKLRRLAGRERDVFKGPGGAYDYLTLNELFPSSRQLVDGLAHGWPSMTKHDADRVPALALKLLGGSDRAVAAALAARILAARPGKLLAEQARALTLTAGNDDAASVLAKLRAQLPDQPHYLQHSELPSQPMVAELRKRLPKPLRAAARDELVRVLGGERPPAWGEIAPADVVYAFALTLLLEPRAPEQDARLLHVVWTEHPHFLLRQPARAKHIAKRLS